jgi:DNA-binding NtrC family response regulator
MSQRVLVVDDEAVLRRNLVRFLRRSGHEVSEAKTAENALELVESEEFTLVLTDLRMPGLGGEGLVERLATARPETGVIVMTAHATVDSAIGALRLGAWDYLLKPLSLDAVERKVSAYLHMRSLERENRRLRHRVPELQTDIVAASGAMKEVLRLVKRAAASRSTVLIEGESGTGKELVARALHEQSPWRGKDYIAVNLAAQPRDLVDATLFGHERGAFTGAGSRREGVFRAAHGGSVFLDELSELSLEVQVKLLRVLENREVMPLGADRALPVDFRLIAATNRPLRPLVEDGTFRQDLLYRVEVLRIVVPPLRERPEDIAPLVQRFVRLHSSAVGRRPPVVSNAVMRALEQHGWPGNVRELSNALERAIILGDGGSLRVEDLPLRESGRASDRRLRSVLDVCERNHISSVLEQCGGDKPSAAGVLGIHLATLYRRMEKLGIG